MYNLLTQVMVGKILTGLSKYVCLIDEKFKGYYYSYTVRSRVRLKAKNFNEKKENTLVPKNLCAIILSTIYLSPKNLGRKFELI